MKMSDSDNPRVGRFSIKGYVYNDEGLIATDNVFEDGVYYATWERDGSLRDDINFLDELIDEYDDTFEFYASIDDFKRDKVTRIGDLIKEYGFVDRSDDE